MNQPPYHLNVKALLKVAKIDRSIRAKVDKTLPKNLTIRYVGALLSLAALAILGQVITPTSVSRVLLLFTTLLLLGIDALYVLRPGVQSLYYALKTRSDFLARMGHELRNPMHSILGTSELLLKTPLDETQRKYVTLLHKSSVGLLETLNHLLDFSTLESAQQKRENAPFDLEKVIEKSFNHVTYAAQANEVELKLDIDPKAPLKLLGDAQRLNQILTNLLGNAVKFTKKGTVTLKVEATLSPSLKLLFSVIDTGIGIEKKKLNRIFDAFVQEDSSIRRRFGGAGLGLSISKDLVTLLGGNLSVESKKFQGSRFYFTLPFTMAPQTTSTSEIQMIQKEIYPTRSLKILVVDDSEDNLFLIEAYLSSLPYQLIFANHGKKALEIFQTTPFDLILMDLHMPELDGYAATQEIRKLESSQSRTPTPIVAVSANDYEQVVSQIRQAGFTSYLMKPMSSDQLKNKIGEMTQKSALLAPSLDPMVADLIPKYLERREVEVKGLTRLLAENQFDQLKTFGHRLSGNAKSFGFEQLGILGKQFEFAAEKKDKLSLHHLIKETKNHLDTLTHPNRRSL